MFFTQVDNNCYNILNEMLKGRLVNKYPLFTYIYNKNNNPFNIISNIF